MRYILFLLLAMFQLPIFSQKMTIDANAVLDKALAILEEVKAAEAPSEEAPAEE